MARGEPLIVDRPRAAVLGSPIRHSLSPVLHLAAYAELGLPYRYDAIEVREDELAAFLDSCDRSWFGLSLTMPLKSAVIPLLDESSDLVRLVGAANTVVLGEQGRVGHNTDVAGIVTALRDAASGRLHRARDVGHGVIVGAGATAASALAAMGSLGVGSVTVHARRPEAAEALRGQAEILGITLVVAGWPERIPGRDEAFVVMSAVPASASAGLAGAVPPDPGLLLDVSYDPWPPPLVVAWRCAGGQAASGDRMLLHQAVGQVRLMTGREPDTAAMDLALGAELARRHA